MKINLDRIKNHFVNHRLTNDEIIKLGSQYERINKILSFKRPIEDVIIEHFKCVLNNQTIREQISKLKMEMRENDNKLMLIKREKFDDLRQKGKLKYFLENVNNDDLDFLNHIQSVQSEEVSEIKLRRFKDKRDEHNRNYNVLNLDGNVSMGSNSEIWR